MQHALSRVIAVVAADCAGAPEPQATSTSSRKLNGNKRTYFIAHPSFAFADLASEHRFFGCLLVVPGAVQMSFKLLRHPATSHARAARRPIAESMVPRRTDDGA